MDKQLYTVVVQGNVAGYPVSRTFVNMTSVVADKSTDTLKLVAMDGSTTTYLKPQPHELVQVAKQDAEIVTEEKQ